MVLRADERTEEETSGRRITRGSWGEQEEQRREEKEGRRGRSTAWWAEMVLLLVISVWVLLAMYTVNPLKHFPPNHFRIQNILEA